MIRTVKDFWRHSNGKIYAIESDTFGKVIKAAGPLNVANLHNIEDYNHKPTITEFVADAIVHHKLRRFKAMSLKGAIVL